MISKKVLLFLVCLNIFCVFGINHAHAFEKPEIFVQLGHSNRITSVTFTSDGKYLVSGSTDRTIKIWEASTGKEIRTLRHDAEVTAITLSPDDKTVLAGDEEGNITIWETATGKPLGKMAVKGLGKIYYLSFSPDGRYAVATDFFQLACLDVMAKKQMFIMDRGQEKFTKDLTAEPKVAAFLKDSFNLALGTVSIDSNDKNKAINIEIYDIKKRKTVKHFEILKGDLVINAMAVSPDEKYFFLSVMKPKPNDIFNKEGKILVVDAGHGGIVKELFFEEPFFQLAYSSNGDYAAAANFGEVIIYDAKNWQVVRKIAAHLPIAFSPDGQSLIHGNDNVWTYYGEWVHKTGLDLIDIKTGNKINRYGANVDHIINASLVAGEREILSDSWILLYWDRQNGTLKKRLILKDPANRMITLSAVSRDGKYMIADNGYGSYIYNAATGELRRMWDKSVLSADFTPDGKILLFSTYDRRIMLWDIENNRQIRQLADWGPKEKLFIDYNKISPDGRKAVVAFNDHEMGEEKNIIIVWDTNTGGEIARYEVKNHTHSWALSPDFRYFLNGEFQYSAGKDEEVAVLRSITDNRIVRKFRGHNGRISALAFSLNGDFILSGSWDQQIILWETKRGKRIKTFAGHAGLIYTLDFSGDDKSFVSASNDGTTRLWDIATGKELAQFISFTDGEWVVITPEGYYNASPNGDKHLNVRIGNNVYSIENYREAFYRPDVVRLALAGKSIENLKTIAEVKQPPLVSIINTPIKTEKDEVKVTLRIEDQGGGIGDIRLYLNGTSVMLDRARGLTLKPKGGDKAIFKEYTVKLINGENIITAVAFNGENTMQSNPATHRIMAEIKGLKKPSLYAVIIGINEYKNPKLTLRYAVADARLFADTLKQISTPLFEDIQIKTITTKEETTKEAIKKTLNELKEIRPDDVFVFYVAAHGTVDEGEYFLLTSNVGSVSTFRLKEDALTQSELKGLIANIPSTKKLIIIDTCSAGKLGEALQVAMLTRGMSEETAVKILSHAVGSTIISASTAIQEALEGYQGHGLFTYVLVEGLKGKADTDRDGFIKTLELATYVDSEVPVLAEKAFKRAQYPTTAPTGVAFPIGKVR